MAKLARCNTLIATVQGADSGTLLFSSFTSQAETQRLEHNAYPSRSLTSQSALHSCMQCPYRIIPTAKSTNLFLSPPLPFYHIPFKTVCTASPLHPLRVSVTPLYTVCGVLQYRPQPSAAGRPVSVCVRVYPPPHVSHSPPPVELPRPECRH